MYSFLMNENEEQIQMHTTYSKYIYLWHYTSLSEWMQLRSILNCTQLTQDVTTYNMIHSFRMNATKEHTQLHTTYSRYITLQAYFSYYYFFFLFLLLFFNCPHPLLKRKCLGIMAIVSLKLPKSLRKHRLKSLPLSLKLNYQID